MARYFFDFEHADQPYPDHEGVQLADDPAAIEEAVVGLLEVAESRLSRTDHRVASILVRSADGPFATVTLTISIDRHLKASQLD